MEEQERRLIINSTIEKIIESLAKMTSLLRSEFKEDRDNPKKLLSDLKGLRKALDNNVNIPLNFCIDLLSKN